jgi:ribonuclease E
MTTRMLINATVANELRIAIVEEGELIELDIETNDQNQLKGNIYKGVVHNVEASLAACFVDIGGHKQGFLPFSEISPALFPKNWQKKDEEARITDVIKRGQEIVVQVAKDAIGEKGVTLTTYLSIPGRFTVLLPGSDANGVSRKIEDETQRKKIRAIASKIERPEDCGFIVRTAGLGQTRTAIQKDLNSVIETYEKVKRSAQIARAPSLLYAEPDLIARTLRDFFTDEIDEIWIDTREEFEAARHYFQELMPDFVETIHWYQNPIPIFAYYHVEEQIEATFHRTVPLPSGGSIVIDETEALVAIDVNSGRMTSERDHEDTVFKTNIEAAEEGARQLKLRDLGGIIVIDFIDMELRKNERLVEKALVEAAKRDKARYKISKINAQGLCVLTRQRIRQGMRRAFQRRCQVCAGTGWLRTPESHSLSLLRRVETRLAQGGVGEARVATHRETAEYLLNMKRAELMALEREHHCRIVVSAKAEMDRNADDVAFLSKGEILAEITNLLPPREERRLDRASKRKSRKKKRGQLGREGEREIAAGSGPGELDREERKKRRRGRRDRGEREAENPYRAPIAEKKRLLQEAEVEGKAADHPDVLLLKSELEELEKKVHEHAQQQALAAAQAQAAQVQAEAQMAEQQRGPKRPQHVQPPRERGRFDGSGSATFTGRPPPEVLERLKAERKARLAQRGGSSPAPGAPPMPPTSPEQKPLEAGVELPHAAEARAPALPPPPQIPAPASWSPESPPGHERPAQEPRGPRERSTHEPRPRERASQPPRPALPARGALPSAPFADRRSDRELRAKVAELERELSNLEELRANVGAHADIEKAIGVRTGRLAEAKAALAALEAKSAAAPVTLDTPDEAVTEEHPIARAPRGEAPRAEGESAMLDSQSTSASAPAPEVEAEPQPSEPRRSSLLERLRGLERPGTPPTSHDNDA